MIQVHRKLKERPKTSCLYYATGAAFKNDCGPRCTLTTYSECNPDACPWYRSQAANAIIRRAFETRRVEA